MAAAANPKAQSLDHLAGVAKAASDPLRLTILRLLARESLGVLELCHVLEIPQPALSHHLKVLLNAGLVATRREGNSVFYRRAPALDDLADALYRQVDDLAIEAGFIRRLSDIHAERAEKSLAFFRRHAERFREFPAIYPHENGVAVRKCPASITDTASAFCPIFKQPEAILAAMMRTGHVPPHLLASRAESRSQVGVNFEPVAECSPFHFFEIVWISHVRTPLQLISGQPRRR